VSVGLRWFLLFVAALVLGLMALAIYLGPNVLAFLFHEGRRTEPFVMVHLLQRQSPTATSADNAELADAVFGLRSDRGGKLLWSARVETVDSVSYDARWTSLALVRYASRAAYVDLVTASEYRAAGELRDRLLARSAMLVAAPRAPLEERVELGAGTAYAARLLTFGTDGSAEKYFREWFQQDTAVVAQHGGVVAWEARLEAFVGDESDRFDHLLIAGFSDQAALEGWLDDPQRATLRTLERRLMKREVVMVLTPDRREPPPQMRQPAPDA
jgi:hypothetical protein